MHLTQEELEAEALATAATTTVYENGNPITTNTDDEPLTVDEQAEITKLQEELAEKNQKIEKLKAREKKNFNKINNAKEEEKSAIQKVKDLEEKTDYVSKFKDNSYDAVKAIAIAKSLTIEEARYLHQGMLNSDPAIQAQRESERNANHGNAGQSVSKTKADEIFSQGPKISTQSKD